ncbi:hypothetical protein [Vibrio sp.]|uniref:hypothetical protein n=1 Tax=Vibrio sp. TaxID=678 RepID=UPI003D098DAE
MSAKKEVHFCPTCGVETQHIVVLVRKESPFKGSKNQKFKEFIAGVIKGWALGAFVASMDEFSRHLICEKCGAKIVQD